MKKNWLFVLFGLLIFQCKSTDVTPLTPTELITLNKWNLDRFTTPTGQIIANNKLNTEAIALYSMFYSFDKNQFVSAFDKANGQLINKGAWNFYEDNAKVSVELVGRILQFKVVSLKQNEMILEASTGNDLSGVGDAVRLVFVPKL